MKNATLKAIYTDIVNRPTRSAWNHGVKLYAFDLIANLAENATLEDLNPDNIERAMLNGARDWNQYSEGGCALIYDEHIARRLCTPSELRRCYYGAKDPNPRETWIRVQARALYQAAVMIRLSAEKVAAATANTTAA